ncbi:HAD family hydrolase [Streptomyces sp. A7024]|uniref:HAD family hydrolase n=1 Tax=Streptomyces coryli TaxID=1128680 RepID=A0A6G4UDS8_9ACTN|nr:HAD family hydrolase [Streptomyces coryli]NGN69826.1 HAD family hydrolase [Streptomyces coryli]
MVASDLDRTLIYSAAALELTLPDAEAPRLLCVEVYQGKPLSFMTEAAAAHLEALPGAFVPVTTRTRAQYARVHLPGPPPRHAICANGGHLLVDGVSDPGWQATVRDALDAGCAPLAEIRAHLARITADVPWLRKQRTAEGLFEVLVVERAELPEAWVKDFAGWADARGWTVSLQGRKLYAVPRPLTKSAALAELVRRTGAGTVLTAGDSLLDTDLLLAGDRGWRPGHGELADQGWTAPHVTALAERGAAAGERILRDMAAAALAGSQA